VQAAKILSFFWPGQMILPSDLSESDISFAQALLVEAIDSSYNMGYVEHIFKSFFMKIPASFGSVRDMIKDFAKAALKHWFKHATAGDLNDPKIYESVRLTLARNFASVWKMRNQMAGEIIY
jgi:hypothetical protein